MTEYDLNVIEFDSLI